MQPWKASKTFFWEEAPFFRLLLPLVLAIICYDHRLLPVTASTTLCIAFFILVSFVCFLFFLRKNNSVVAILRIVFLHVALFALGWLACATNDITTKKNWFGNHLKNAEAFEAKVLENPAEKERTWKVNVDVQSTMIGEDIKPVHGDAFVYIYKSEDTLRLRAGDHILLPNKWIAIKNPGNPFEFNYEKFCSRNNVYFQQFLSSDEIIKQRSSVTKSSFVVETHEWAMTALQTHVKDSATLGLLQAMLLGDDVNFSQELRQSYADTGIVHIVAISGAHVMIFFQIVALCMFWIRHKKFLFLKYLIAVPLVYFYVAVAGAPTSAVRAAIMFTFLALGLAFQKDRQPINQLFATAFFMLLYEPMWLFSVGFQLSFSAVLSIIIFYRPIYRILKISNKWLNKLWQAAAVSIAAELLIAPLVIYYFHLLPMTFLIANLVAYLFMSAVLVTGLLLIAFSKVNFLAAILAYLLSLLTTLFNTIVKFFQQLNPESFRHLHLDFFQLLLVYAIILFFAVFLVNRKKMAIFPALTAACLLVILLTIDKWNALHQQKFVVYNINRIDYAEFLNSTHFSSLLTFDSIDKRKQTYATKEAHIAWNTWRNSEVITDEILKVNGKTIAILKQPINLLDSIIAVDYVLINYPVKEFNGQELRNAFRCKQILLAGNQKRYIMERWRDSCARYGISAHFTMFDGAFVVNEN